MKLSKELLKFKDSKYALLLPDFKKDKTRKISSIVFSLIALSFLGLFAINPTLSTIAKLRKDLEDSKFVSQKLQEKISNLYTLQKKYSLIQEDIPVVLAAIPNNPQAPTLMGQIQTLAKENNIAITSIQSSQVEALAEGVIDKKFSTFSFTVAGEGNYNSIINFISSLTNMQRVISIDNLSISKERESGNLFVINGKSYFKN